MRQDTILRRVIILFNNQEEILYNFNKNVGDTANLLCLLGGVSTYTLIYKDSVLLSEGLYHKRFNFGGNGPGNIIEGVGSQKSLFLSYCSGFDTYSTLQCLAQVTPSMTIYSSGYCPLMTDIKTNADSRRDFLIYPNPSNDIINISMKNTLLVSVEILDLMGSTILSVDKVNSLNTTIDLRNFQSGLYLVKVNFENNTVSKPFIKTD